MVTRKSDRLPLSGSTDATTGSSTASHPARLQRSRQPRIPHAFTTGTKRNRELRATVYTQIKERWSLGAQAAQHVIKKACDAYAALAGKQARRTRDINHKISKRIVAEAQRTGRGIALEDLSGIRERARLKKPQRVTINSWAFGRLGSFIDYKARRAGVPVVYVTPAYTSQECSHCHHIDKRNRPHQAVFACRSCGFVEHADLNASHVIGQRGWWAWVCEAESQVPVLILVA